MNMESGWNVWSRMHTPELNVSWKLLLPCKNVPMGKVAKIFASIEDIGFGECIDSQEASFTIPIEGKGLYSPVTYEVHWDAGAEPDFVHRHADPLPTRFWWGADLNPYETGEERTHGSRTLTLVPPELPPVPAVRWTGKVQDLSAHADGTEATNPAEATDTTEGTQPLMPLNLQTSLKPQAPLSHRPCWSYW